jgi:hypothetical protein
VTTTLQERARRARERALVRAWEYRQRDYSKGVWYRLRRVLVDAARAWIIDETTANRLQALGWAPHPVGMELSPARRIFILPEQDAGTVGQHEEVPVRLSSRLLLARSLVLVRHGDGTDAP